MTNLDSIKKKAETALELAEHFERTGNPDSAESALNEASAAIREIEAATAELNDKADELRQQLARTRRRTTGTIRQHRLSASAAR